MSDNDMRGAIWGNKKKTNDKQPDFTGNAMIDGKEYRVAAWKKKPDANPKAPSLSFRFELLEEDRGVSQDTEIDPSDEIPF